MDKFFKCNSFESFKTVKARKDKCKNIIKFFSIPLILISIFLNNMLPSISVVIMILGIFSLLLTMIIFILQNYLSSKEHIQTWNDNYYIHFKDSEMFISRPYCSGIGNKADAMEYQINGNMLLANVVIKYVDVDSMSLEEVTFGNLRHGHWKARILSVRLKNSKLYHIYPTHFSKDLFDLVEEIFRDKIVYEISKDYLNEFYEKDKVNPL